MAKFEHDDGTFSDLTPEEFKRVKGVGDRMLKEAMAQRGHHRVQVGTLFGCPIYLDESVPDGEFELEPRAWNRRHPDAAPGEAELHKALERAWLLLDRGASREQAIGVIADALGLNELPRDSE